MIARENMQIKREITPKVALSSEIKKESIAEKEPETTVKSESSLKQVDGDKYFNIIPKKALWIGSSILALSVISFVLYKKYKK